MPVKKIKKITIYLPEELLRRAQRATHDGITKTIQEGLKLLAAGQAYEKLQAMRGKVRFSLSLKKLREDR
jgi:hypothetical protein